MLPVLALGPWQIGTYAATYALALFVAGMWAFHRLCRGLPHPPRLLARGLVLAIGAAFIGAHLVRLLPTLQEWQRTGSVAWFGGSSFAGALAGGCLAALLYFRRHQVPLGRALDLGAALPFPLGQAIGRLGCLAAGCCYGRPTASPLGLYLPDHEGLWAVRHPTQLLAAGADLLILAVLLAVEGRGRRHSLQPGTAPPPAGSLFLVYLALYSLKRFALEFLRGDGLPAAGALSWAHLYSLAALAVALALLLGRHLRGLRAHGQPT